MSQHSSLANANAVCFIISDVKLKKAFFIFKCLPVTGTIMFMNYVKVFVSCYHVQYNMYCFLKELSFKYILSNRNIWLFYRFLF